MTKTIKIYVAGGVVQDVHGVPEGYTLEIIDLDENPDYEEDE